MKKGTAGASRDTNSKSLITGRYIETQAHGKWVELRSVPITEHLGKSVVCEEIYRAIAYTKGRICLKRAEVEIIACLHLVQSPAILPDLFGIASRLYCPDHAEGEIEIPEVESHKQRNAKP